MKIITENSIFVQRNDITYLNQSNLEVPTSIFGNGVSTTCNVNKYDFIEFKEKEEIDFFKNIDWLIDYNEVKDLSEDEIIRLIENTLKERNETEQKFNFMIPKQKKKNINLLFQCELLDFKKYSLRDILWFKQGKIKMNLPEGVEYLDGSKQEIGARKLIKKIFNRNKY